MIRSISVAARCPSQLVTSCASLRFLSSQTLTCRLDKSVRSARISVTPLISSLNGLRLIAITLFAGSSASRFTKASWKGRQNRSRAEEVPHELERTIERRCTETHPDVSVSACYHVGCHGLRVVVLLYSTLDLTSRPFDMHACIYGGFCRLTRVNYHTSQQARPATGIPTTKAVSTSVRRPVRRGIRGQRPFLPPQTALSSHSGMSLFKRNSAAVSITETKPSIQHAENANEDGSPRASKEKDVQPAAVTGCDGQIVDEETAKYLDSSIVIDAETNTQIKRMASWQSNSGGVWVV